MNPYNEKAFYELKSWKMKMAKEPSIADKLTKGIQNKTNSLIPEKVHSVITAAIKNMVKAVLVGSEYTTGKPIKHGTLEERENLVKEKLNFYKKAAIVSGAGTGSGGILLGLADFPILLSLKMKFLFDVAGIYGFDVKDCRERIYILYVFQLAFSSQQNRNKIFRYVKNWDRYIKDFPYDINSLDWRSFQIEYRDYIDLAKMLQMVPGIGAAVGAFANYKLMDNLGYTAINAYRMRVFKRTKD